jgi:hypothetical protein
MLCHGQHFFFSDGGVNGLQVLQAIPFRIECLLGIRNGLFASIDDCFDGGSIQYWE